MNKQEASVIMEAALAFDAPIHTIAKRIKSLSDEKEKEHFLEIVGQVLGILTKDIVFPIASQYPDLDPDR